MSRKTKQKILEYQDRTNLVKEFVNNYQHCLRALKSSLPANFEIVMPEDFVTIGLSEIWPCQDGAVVLMYRNPANDIQVVVKPPLNKTINEFLLQGRATAFYDVNGQPLREHAGVQINIKPIPFLTVASPTIAREPDKNVVYQTRYQKAFIFGWEVSLPIPDKLALEDFKTVFVTKNIGGPESISLPFHESKQITLENAERIIKEFRDLLEASEKEDDLQRFLADHPELIYPDYIRCTPKLELGSEYITDYVFSVQGIEALEYCFVEIENSNKPIFTKLNTFSKEFTQAKDQLLAWERWITLNHSYISSKLSGLYKPKFHLIMGRNSRLSLEQREKLATEFGNTTTRIFSTYDDLIERFQQILGNLQKNNSLLG